MHTTSAFSSAQNLNSHSQATATSSPPFTLPEILPINSDEAVIFGDGPIALFVGIRLKQLGVKKVKIIGPRLGEFTRSGDYVDEVFEEISQAIAPLSIKASPGCHIKDVERQLYEHAKNLGVELVNKQFHAFAGNREIEIIEKGEKKQHTISLIRCDFVIDCTGTKRAIIHHLNDKMKQEKGTPYFAIHESPVFYSHYALIRARFSIDTYEQLISSSALNPLSYCLGMEALHDMGWDSFARVYAYANPKSDFNPNDPNIDNTDVKFNVFLQVPATLTKDKVPDFTKATFATYERRKEVQQYMDFQLHEPTRKHDPKEKEMISTFEIKPCQVSPSFYPGDQNYPNVFHAGDATANLPFVSGFSLRGGRRRTDKELACFNIDNHGIVINFNAKKFAEILIGEMKEYHDKLTEWDTNTKNFAEQTGNNNKRFVLNQYYAALKMVQDPKDKDLVVRGLTRIENSFAVDIITELNKRISIIIDDQTGFKIANDTGVYITQKIFFLFEMANNFTTLSQENKKALAEIIKDTSERCRKVAEYYLKLQPTPLYNIAQKYSELASSCNSLIMENKGAEANRDNATENKLDLSTNKM